MLPYNFFISSIAAGLAVVSVEYSLASSVFKHACDLKILRGLAKGTAIMLLIYFVLRVGDIMIKGNLGLIGEGNAGMLFVLEMLLVLVPMVLLFIQSGFAKSIATVIVPQLLVLAGVILNRMDVLFLTLMNEGSRYKPTIIEIVVTAGLIAAIVLAYRIAAMKLPIAASADN